jgi:hypothetical protein
MKLRSSRAVSFLFFIIVILVSGCVSSSNVNASLPITTIEQSTLATTVQYMGNQSHWIRIDPIEDFHSESPFNITGSTTLNISRTTTFPAGSLFFVNIIEEERSRSLLSNVVIPAEKKSDGSITFSYSYDMKGNPPAHYRVEIRKANQNFTAMARFKITSQAPWLWIAIDPIGETRKGENLTITGTTNLPVGSEISVISRLEYHSCARQPGPRTPFCNGTCSGAISQSTIGVMPSPNEKNTWTYTINTTEWCTHELYSIWTGVNNWTNVSSESTTIQLG